MASRLLEEYNSMGGNDLDYENEMKLATGFMYSGMSLQVLVLGFYSELSFFM
jgi:hypothetical protein